MDEIDSNGDPGRQAWAAGSATEADKARLKKLAAKVWGKIVLGFNGLDIVRKHAIFSDNFLGGD